MKVGFFTVFRKDPQHYVLAERLTQSVRATMPGVEIVHFTDETSPAALGVDAVRRKPNGPMLERRLEHYADAEGEWLLLDTDVLLQADVRDVFAADFDVAVTDRQWPHLPPGVPATMPYNTGVVFSRSSAFWRAVLARWRAYPEPERDWLSEQRAVAEVIATDAFRVHVLPGVMYNYPPDDAHPGAHAKVLHFKGPRKALMLARTTARPGARPMPRGANEPLRVFIGYDPRQPVASAVAAHAVATRARGPVAITRLQLSQLPIARRGLTEFTYSRFLVPWLSGFTGWAVYLDADTLCLADVGELLAAAQANPVAPVHAVLGPQRFEWASVMVFDAARCAMLTPDAVENPALPLFDFAWAGEVGALPAAWNHLVGYDAPNPGAQLVHFTQGIPVWPETVRCEHAPAWHAERTAMMDSVSFGELMGSSVHARRMARA